MQASALNIGVTLSDKLSANQHEGIVIGEIWRQFECSPFFNFVVKKKEKKNK